MSLQPTTAKRQQWIREANTESWHGPGQAERTPYSRDKTLTAIPETTEEEERATETTKAPPKLTDLEKKA